MNDDTFPPFAYDDEYDSEIHSEDSTDSEDDDVEMKDPQEFGNSQDQEIKESIYRKNTATLRSDLQGRMLDKVLKVLHCMGKEGIDLPIFLHALSWGDTACTHNETVQYARSCLLGSIELGEILPHWYNPPRSHRYRKKRAVGAGRVLVGLAQDIMKEVVIEEVDNLAPYFTSSRSGTKDVQAEELTSIHFDNLHSHCLCIAPNLSSILDAVAVTPVRLVQGKHRKCAKKLTPIIASLLSYSRNHSRNRLQKMFSIYFKFRGLTAKGFDTLHAIGFTMSFKWTANSISRMSHAAMVEVKQFLQIYPWLLTYDNIDITFRVFSKRLSNFDQFTSATACTVYLRPGSVPLSHNANRSFQESRKGGLNNPLTGLDLFDLAQSAQPSIEPHEEFIILQFLLGSPDFESATYSGISDPACPFMEVFLHYSVLYSITLHCSSVHLFSDTTLKLCPYRTCE